VSVQGKPQDYAAAIYDLALEPWLQQLGSVQQALKKDRALRDTLSDVDRSTGEKLTALNQAVPGGLLPEVRKFLGSLLEAGQFDQLEAILAEFDRLVRRRPVTTRAQVTSAVPLTESEREAIRAKLIERYGPNLEFEFNVDASLIGGIHLRVGDQVIDGSVAGKLAALRDRLAA
jgi:F-type H+-transporting ATPase subunit delta